MTLALIALDLPSFALGVLTGAAAVFLLIGYFTKAYAEPAERAIADMRSRCWPSRTASEQRIAGLRPLTYVPPAAWDAFDTRTLRALNASDRARRERRRAL